MISLRGGGPGDGEPEMYFFDITDISAGDVFAINTTGDAGGQVGYIGPVSWDYFQVPEPSAGALAAFAFLGLTLVRRRKRSGC